MAGVLVDATLETDDRVRNAIHCWGLSEWSVIEGVLDGQGRSQGEDSDYQAVVTV